MLTIGVGLGMFVAGVLFADKIKGWFSTEKAAAAAEVTKVEAKL
jgi:hypothetical protein